MSTARTISAAEAAQLLGISVPAVYRHIKAERLQVVRLGKRVLVLREALERLLAPAPTEGVA